MNDAAGYVLVRDLLGPELCDELIAALPAVPPGRGGQRDLLQLSAVADLVRSPAIAALVGDGMIATRATLFDKTAAANWKVSWHQDRGTESMLAVRLHLDDSGPGEGALRVLPGTHRLGRLRETELVQVAAAHEAVELRARKCDGVFLRPLLIHSSRAAERPSHRRVLHIEFAPVII